MNKTFARVAAAKVGRSAFNLSWEKKMTGKMGRILPNKCEDVVPGDIFDMSTQAVLRFMPLVAPIMHEIYLHEYCFFVPYRLLMSEALGDDGDFEDMIKGGDDGDTDIAIPQWQTVATGVTGLWDSFGFPIGVDCEGFTPCDFPKRAYNLIWNEFFRDVDIDDELDITTSEDVLSARWMKDYFTSCRPWQQRGTSPSLPISGIIPVDPNAAQADPIFKDPTGDTARLLGVSTNVANFDNAVVNGTMYWSDPNLQVDLGNALTFDTNDIRLAVSIQRWMERNARSGTRYTDFLRAHFGVNPRDDRLQRPEFIGGYKTPIIISEVLQTSKTDGTAYQGTMTGHGISVSNTRIGKYRVQEYGIILSVIFVMPVTGYSQRVDRQWIKNTLYDFYFPEFANLSEQPVYRGEIYANSTPADNTTVFGYQGKYNEMRTRRNISCRRMAYNQTFDHWNMDRQWTAYPELDSDFLSSTTSAGDGGIRSEMFAASSEEQFVITLGNIIKAIRPLPIVSNPGYLDHV